ncbi:MAG: hypothetical protein Q4B71_01390 [Cardiobacteriaceae bacterium]|nr:hypothetical protein [Cardiobacteriaceae bacterium]
MQRIIGSLLVLMLTACLQSKSPNANQTAFTYQTEELPSAQTEGGTLETYSGQSAAYSDPELFSQTIESIGDFEKLNFRCQDLQHLQTRVMQAQEEPARVEEIWQLQVCGVIHHYKVVFTRDSSGQTVPAIHYLPNPT